MLERRHAENPASLIETIDTPCGECDSLTDIFLSVALGGILWGAARGVNKMAGSDHELQPREIEIALVPEEPRNPE